MFNTLIIAHRLLWLAANTFTFRLDNDDALPKGFIQNLKKYAKTKYQEQAITMPDIKVVQRIDEDKYLLESRKYISNSMGLAYVSSPDNPKSIMELGNHGHVGEIVPLIIDNSQGGLQTVNGTNCYNKIKHRKKAKELNLKELKQKLSKHFPNLTLSVLKTIS